jgi:hypothetical protein
VAEVKISKAALLELMKQNGYAKDTELSNIMWFDLFATVYWVASDSYGMTAGSSAYSSSLSFSGKELDRDAQHKNVTASIHSPEMLVFGNEKRITGCSYTSKNESEIYLIKKPSCSEKGSYYVSCDHCKSAGLSVFEGTKTLAHNYLYRVKDSKYLASTANCTNAARYYYSCVCGDHSEDFFDYEKPLGHEAIFCGNDEIHRYHSVF